MNDMASITAFVERQLAVPARPASATVAFLLLLAAAVLMAWPVRLWLLRLIGRLLGRFDSDSDFRKHAGAVATVIVSLLALTIAGQLVLSGLETGFTLLSATRMLADRAAAGFFTAGLGLGIGRALHSPDDPARRPFALPDGLGAAMAFYPLAGGIMLGVAGFVEGAVAILHLSPLSRTIAHGIVLLVEAVLGVRFLVAIGGARNALAEASSAGGNVRADPDDMRSAGGMLTAITWAAIAIGLLAFLFGRLRFAVFLFQEMIWAGLVCVAAILLVHFLDRLIGLLLGREHAAGRFATRIIGIGGDRISQACLLASALSTILVWSLAAGLILAPFGGAGITVVDQIQPSLLLGNLRSLHIAPRTLAKAVLVLAAGLLLTRLAKRWLEKRFLPATTLDIGVRSSFAIGVGYAGSLIALLAATNVLGINLDKITLIASALSVGIGFGLQSIIQNFVSGVILLVERPIKIGDWVSASGAEGNVRRINIRATELTAADGGVFIVPNSSFISAPVQNRTEAGVAGRVEMTLRVSGDVSAREAGDAILGIIRGQGDVAADPAPALLFTDLNDAGYGFTLHAYGKGGRPLRQVRSDLLYALVEASSKRGLKISVS